MRVWTVKLKSSKEKGSELITKVDVLTLQSAFEVVCMLQQLSDDDAIISMVSHNI